MIKTICKTCRKEFFDYPCYNKKFCSRKCHHEDMIGKKHPNWNEGKKLKPVIS